MNATQTEQWRTLKRGDMVALSIRMERFAKRHVKPAQVPA